ncbi:hypothetical protein [Moritella sp. F3]|uniref:hypothetical protein n=1 Tax=Moritella sp. F3 TaxID=2718882 RepID=UPI0018E18032|nr:hypothetical protein [Moritella sp. F3]GIC79491.1 hypothetical protein FMO001_42180 [Moritella sp. F1]GIC79769.1 hypothetical protein FMO003_00500 [Moritella sp. F3]
MTHITATNIDMLSRESGAHITEVNVDVLTRESGAHINAVNVDMLTRESGAHISAVNVDLLHMQLLPSVRIAAIYFNTGNVSLREIFDKQNSASFMALVNRENGVVT